MRNDAARFAFANLADAVFRLGFGICSSELAEAAQLSVRLVWTVSNKRLSTADEQQGWLSTISWQSIVALNCYLVGTIVQSLVIINNESYAATRWQATLLILASAIGIGLFNIFGAKHLPLAEGIFAICHFFAFFPVIIVILVLAPKTTPEAVFLSFTDNGSGWPNVAWGTLVGQVSAMFCVLGKSGPSFSAVAKVD